MKTKTTDRRSKVPCGQCEFGKLVARGAEVEGVCSNQKIVDYFKKMTGGMSEKVSFIELETCKQFKKKFVRQYKPKDRVAKETRFKYQ